MDGIVPCVRHSVKERLYKHLAESRDGGLRTRYLIVVNLLHGRSVQDTAAACHAGRSTVYSVAKRFREYGEVGLLDRREDNGLEKLDEAYLAILYEVVDRTRKITAGNVPRGREMLVETMHRKTGVRIHVTTMSRASSRSTLVAASLAPRWAAPGRNGRRTSGFARSRPCSTTCDPVTWRCMKTKWTFT